MGFSFNGKHTDSFGISVKSVSRSLKPSKRVFRTKIGGRDGSLDFSDGSYENIEIKIDCDCRCNGKDASADEIALWLSSGGELILDGEPDRIYSANLYSGVPLSQLGRMKSFSLAFECFPLAMSLPHQINAEITEQGQETAFKVGGTARTPCVLIIKNTGDTPITDIRLTHRKEV